MLRHLLYHGTFSLCSSEGASHQPGHRSSEQQETVGFLFQPGNRLSAMGWFFRRPLWESVPVSTVRLIVLIVRVFDMQQTVAVIGCGAMGTACATVLAASSQHNVR
ncbi:MAG: hypothetical protein ACK58T_50000, partial [Phycisphaerae bacterium]